MKKAEPQYGVIESGKPMPISKGRGLKYPWDKMKPGDRIAVPGISYAQSANVYSKRHGLKAKFVQRTIDGTFYVYRVS